MTGTSAVKSAGEVLVALRRPPEAHSESERATNDGFEMPLPLAPDRQWQSGV